MKHEAKENPCQAENRFMQTAIDEARIGITEGHGGPFGAVVVKEGKIIARAHNRVLADHDPTAHGEIGAIRLAGRALNTHDLSGCELYTTGEPCPMCLGACLWANLSTVYYGCTIEDNGKIGFRDDIFDKKMGGRADLADFLKPLDRDACLALFEDYEAMEKTLY